jgi:DNA modification methylase
MIIQEINKSNYAVRRMDGAKGMLLLPDKSIKLIYGSPPYPNAEREYGVWRSSEYIRKMSPFLDSACLKLRDDGFIVINVKANREKSTSKCSSKRSLVIEKLAIEMEETWGLHCVDIEIWVKENPVPTGLRVACQDAYEQNLWFSKSSKWTINIDAIRRPYESHSVQTYETYEYKPRSNGNTYVRKNKRIAPNPLGALPKNIISGGVSARIDDHPATQPLYLPQKYIKATTAENDLVVDPWMGSGTTGYAALSLGRRFVGFDVVEEYVEHAASLLRSIAGGHDNGKEKET